jgi:DNA polymerase elongation subunit (family B)
VDSYGGIIKSVVTSKIKGHGPLRLAKPGTYLGSWVELDYNSLYPFCMATIDPPTGSPTVDGEDYRFGHIHKPEIASYLSMLYATKQNAPTPQERSEAKTLLNSLYGYLLKKPKSRVAKKLTPRSVARNRPLLQKVDEDRGVFYIRNGLDLSSNYCQWGREILAKARSMMERLVATAESAGYPVVYSHTDSIVVSADALPLFQDQIGTKMG